MATTSPHNHEPTGTNKQPPYNPQIGLQAPSHTASQAAVQSDDKSQAVALIRQKLAAIYSGEPDAAQELEEAELPRLPHSKHQQFMLSLQRSGKSTVEIQRAWHDYYQQLPTDEKRQVWQEFYAQNTQIATETSPLAPQAATSIYSATAEQQPATGLATHQPTTIYPTPTTGPIAVTTPPATKADSEETHEQPLPVVSTHYTPESAQSTIKTDTFSFLKSPIPDKRALTDSRTAALIRKSLRRTVNDQRKLQAKHHLQSLLFGLGFGALALLIVMFSFFNEVVIAPFIQPSRAVSATPIIVSAEGITASDKNEVIIPKINVQIPLDFSTTTTSESEFEAALDRGVAHYPTTALPGQRGNASFFGHSSNNIFNPGKYKFAFVLLHELVPGDTFYITYNGTVYAYQVYDVKVVEPTQVDILNPVPDKTATALLVTCDPPGTSLRRLAVWGEQVSPSPNSNIAATDTTTTTQSASENLPGNGPTLWGRFVDWVGGN